MTGAAIAEARAHLRIDGAAEDALLERLVASALVLAERFTGQVAIRRTVVETVAATGAWQRLAACPVLAVTAVQAVVTGGGTAPLAAGAYAVDLDGQGGAWIRVAAGGPARVAVTLEAGMAETWEALPEPVRHGVVRLAAHHFTHRDAADEAGPPAAVAALWRPWRRMRLA